jgi:myo-inositol-1(or 4)-monophosphatase
VPFPSPPRPELPPDARAVVSEARALVHELCDGLRPWLLAEAGARDSTAKSDGTPVTAADLEADRIISAAITEAFPRHGLISEEGARTRWDGNEWTWVVDPIDGTSNFTAGFPYWCVSVALVRNGVPVYGCVDAPPLASRFEAVAGEGATRNGEPIHVRAPVDFRSGANAHVPVIVSSGTIRRASGKVRLNARVAGSMALDLAMVAGGHAIATYQRVPRVWDVAAGWLLVIEAGGAYVPLGDPPLVPVPRDRDLWQLSSPGIAGPDATWLEDLVGALG